MNNIDKLIKNIPASRLTIPRYIKAAERVLLTNIGVIIPAINQDDARVLKRLESWTFPALESFVFLAIN